MGMRGDDRVCGSFFSYIDLEARVRAEHPLRSIREIANTALAALSGDFEALYSGLGRPSIPPEKLLRAMLLQAFYSVRSERQLMERIEFDLLFRWFVGIGIDDPVWDHSSFSTNRVVEELRTLNVRPHVAQNNSGRRSAIDRRTAAGW